MYFEDELLTTKDRVYYDMMRDRLLNSLDIKSADVRQEFDIYLQSLPSNLLNECHDYLEFPEPDSYIYIDNIIKIFFHRCSGIHTPEYDSIAICLIFLRLFDYHIYNTYINNGDTLNYKSKIDSIIYQLRNRFEYNSTPSVLKSYFNTEIITGKRYFYKNTQNKYLLKKLFIGMVIYGKFLSLFYEILKRHYDTGGVGYLACKAHFEEEMVKMKSI